MLYTFEQLMTEYTAAEEAHAVAYNALKEATARAREAMETRPEGARFSPEWVEKYREEYDEPEQRARVFEHETALYKECIIEMLTRATREAIETTIYNPDFIGDGMPLRYKKWQAAAKAKLPAAFEMYPAGYCAFNVYWVITDPATGEYLRRVHVLPDFMVYGTDGIEDPVHNAGKYTGKPYTRDEGATFAQVHKACTQAATYKEKHAAILDAAQEKAHALADKHAAGLNTLYFEITGRK